MLFLAIVVYIGLHPWEDYFSYWSSDPLFSSEFIQGIPLSRNVFSSILTFLHDSDIDPCSIDPTDRLHSTVSSQQDEGKLHEAVSTSSTYISG